MYMCVYVCIYIYICVCMCVCVCVCVCVKYKSKMQKLLIIVFKELLEIGNFIFFDIFMLLL